MLRKFIERVLSISVISAMIFTTGVQAAEKPENPKSATLIIGELSIPYKPANSVYAVRESALRGYKGIDLDPIYVSVDIAGNKKYYNLSLDWALNDNSKLNDGIDYWKKVKYVSTGSGTNFDRYDNIKLSSDSTIETKPAFNGLITINDNKISIPSNTTKSIFESMIEPGTDKNTTQTFTYNPDPNTGAITDGTSLTVTAEDGNATHNYTFKVSAGEGGGSIDLSVDQLKSVLRTQIAGANALLDTLPDGQKKLTLMIQ